MYNITQRCESGVELNDRLYEAWVFKQATCASTCQSKHNFKPKHSLNGQVIWKFTLSTVRIETKAVFCTSCKHVCLCCDVVDTLTWQWWLVLQPALSGYSRKCRFWFQFTATGVASWFRIMIRSQVGLTRNYIVWPQYFLKKSSKQQIPQQKKKGKVDISWLAHNMLVESPPT